MLYLLIACTIAPKGDFAVMDLEVGSCTGDSATVPSLSATPGSGSIAVTHVGYRAACCLDFEVSAVEGAGSISVTYTAKGEECDCMCSYDLSYTLGGVPAGDWTVQTPDGLTADVTVE